MILKNFSTKDLSKNHIKQINHLKKNHWKYNIKDQYKWFDLNAHKKDLHFLVFIGSKLTGYVHLSLRSFYLDKNLRNKNKYILFRNLLVIKKYRKLGVARLIMNSVNHYVKKKKLFSFLLCKKRVFKFYQNFDWKKLNKTDYKLIDHEYSAMAMTFNLKKNKKKNRYFFSHHH